MMLYGHTLAFALALCVAVFAVELDPVDFKKRVLDDDKVWLVDFYSKLCTFCAAFNPTWEKIEGKMKGLGVMTGKVCIDTPEGEKLATDLGVFDAGMPHVRMFNTYNGGFSIQAGHDVDRKLIKRKIQHGVFGLIKGAEGAYLKEASKEGHVYDEEEGLVVKDVDLALRDI